MYPAPTLPTNQEQFISVAGYIIEHIYIDTLTYNLKQLDCCGPYYPSYDQIALLGQHLDPKVSEFLMTVTDTAQSHSKPFLLC